MTNIILTVNGGVVELESELPEGVTLEIRDYDSENYDEDMSKDADGKEYKEIIFL